MRIHPSVSERWVRRAGSRGLAYLLPTALVVLAACASEARAQSPSVQGQEASADLTTLPSRSVDEELRIGSTDGGPTSLTDFRSVAIVAGGRIVVPLRVESVLRVFGPEGRHLRDVGRRGGGPGEFREIRKVWYRNDTLAVVDRGLARVTFFDTGTWEVIGTYSLYKPDAEVDAWGRPITPKQLLVDGTWYAPGAISSAQMGVAPLRVSQWRLSADGEIVDTLAVLTYQRHPWVLYRGLAGASSVWYSPRPYAFGDAAVTSDDGRWFVLVTEDDVRKSQAEIGVEVTDIATGTHSRHRYAVERIPFRRELLERYVGNEVSKIRDGFAKTSRALPPEGRIRRLVREGLGKSPPAHFPSFSRVRVTTRGEVWLRLSPALELLPPTERREVWALIAPNGEPLFTVRLPNGMELLQATRHTIWAKELDLFDVPYLVKLEVQ